MKRLLLILALCLVPLGALALDTGPAVRDGKGEAQLVLPREKRVRNIGGSDGAGLCVFTSIQQAAEWGDVPALKDFQHFMSSRPGGGYPSKVTKMIEACAKGHSLPVPDYLQYEGTDPSVLKLAVKTRRMPCVTYDGRDTHYRGHIEHMVNIAGWDDKDQWVVIQDNNFPQDDQFDWLTPAEFQSRWLGGSGRQGWAVILLDNGCPPKPKR